MQRPRARATAHAVERVACHVDDVSQRRLVGARVGGESLDERRRRGEADVHEIERDDGREHVVVGERALEGELDAVARRRILLVGELGRVHLAPVFAQALDETPALRERDDDAKQPIAVARECSFEAVAHRRRCSQIVGLDHHRTCDDSQIMQMLDAHLRAVRTVPCAANARVVALFESNLGMISSQLADKLLTDDPTARVVCSDMKQYGVRTSSRDAYVQHMRDVLAHGRLVYHESLVAANPLSKTRMSDAGRAAEARATQFRQLASFRTELVRNVDGEKRRLRHTVGVHHIDDLGLTTMICLYWLAQYIERRVRFRDANSQLARVYSSFARPPALDRHAAFDDNAPPPAPPPTNAGSLAKRARLL